MGGAKLGRLTTRCGISSLMLLVALSAMLIYAGRKAGEFKAIRTRYLAKAHVHSMVRKSGEAQLKGKKQTNPVVRAWISELCHYHRDLEDKYLLAAAKPWVTLEADPPRPRRPTYNRLLEDAISRSRGPKTQTRRDPPREIPEHDYF